MVSAGVELWKDNLLFGQNDKPGAFHRQVLDFLGRPVIQLILHYDLAIDPENIT